MTEISVALISLAGVLVTAGVAWRRVNLERQKALQAEKEMLIQTKALGFSEFLEDWQSVAAEMSAMIAETEIDRVLILRAWNGSLTPKWTTAVYQMRECGQQPRQYIHFELDSDYVDRLRSIISGGPLCFSVKEAPDSFIKSVYQAEGVKASCWWHIDTREVPGTGAAVITYVSFSTHEDGGISASTQTRCMLMAGRLKGLSAVFAG